MRIVFGLLTHIFLTESRKSFIYYEQNLSIVIWGFVPLYKEKTPEVAPERS